MTPIPCIYCGINFMKRVEEDRVCNNCSLRFSKVNVSQSPSISNKSTVKAQIEMPDQLYKQIEEYCINEGISLSTYFLGLSHYFKGKENIEREEDPPELFLPVLEENISIDKKIIPKSLKTKRKREKNIDN